MVLQRMGCVNTTIWGQLGQQSSEPRLKDVCFPRYRGAVLWDGPESPDLFSNAGVAGAEYDYYSTPEYYHFGSGGANTRHVATAGPNDSFNRYEQWAGIESYNDILDLENIPSSLSSHSSRTSSEHSETAKGYGCFEDSQLDILKIAPSVIADSPEHDFFGIAGALEMSSTRNTDNIGSAWDYSGKGFTSSMPKVTSRRSGGGIGGRRKLLLGDTFAARPATATSDTKKFVCKQPECRHFAFSRHADLERHILHVHRPPGSRKKPFYCDYDDCNRRTSPHHRKDHFRDHLRDVHREDLIKHGSNAHGPSPTAPSVPLVAAAAAAATTTAIAPLTAKQQMERLWLCSLPTDLTWWRCSKCLHRVPVAEKGYSCCKTQIEGIRLEVRKTKAALLDM